MKTFAATTVCQTLSFVFSVKCMHSIDLHKSMSKKNTIFRQKIVEFTSWLERKLNVFEHDCLVTAD